MQQSVKFLSVRWGINPASKASPPLFCQAPLNLQTVQASPFLAIPPNTLVFCEPPLKN